MKIAVFLPNWIGDAVMATPALRSLREHFHDAHLIGVLKPYVAGVLQGLPWLDDQVFLDSEGPRLHRWPAVASRLRHERVDLAVLFQNSFRSALVAWSGSCRRRVGFARHGRSFLLTQRLQPVRNLAGQLIPSPVIDDYSRLVEAIGCPKTSYRMGLSTTPRDDELARAIWQRAGWATPLDAQAEVVCLNPGAAFGSAKHWPVGYFAELARLLADRRGSGIMVLCGPGEREMAAEIVRLSGRRHVHSLADQPLSIGLTKACVRRCDLLITTDSGPRHFAAAFDRPVVTLFGPTHIAWTETYQAKAVHLQKKVDCGPCQLRTCPLDHRCMRTLGPVEVFTAAVDILTRYPPVVRRDRLASAG